METKKFKCKDEKAENYMEINMGKTMGGYHSQK